MSFTATSLLLLCCFMGDAPTEPVSNEVACQELCQRDRLFGRVEFLWWYLKKDEVPALVSTGPEGTTGLPGAEGVSVIYDGSIASRHDRFIGVRPTLGYWFDDQQTKGLEISAFFLERDSSILHIKRVTTPLFRLYTDAETGETEAYQFAGLLPNGVTRRGSIQVYGRKEIYGEDIRGLFQIQESDTWRWYGIAGAKFLQFRNQLNITTTGYDEPELNVLYGVEDNFFTYNRFYGGQLGLRAETKSGDWFLNGTASCALGGTEQRIKTWGSRLVQTPLSYDRRPVGLMVQYTNTGDSTRWVFDAVPELTVNLGYSPRDWFSIQVGYSFLFWMNTLRASDQIDSVNTEQINGPDFTGPARPIIPWKESSFWAQGLSIGAELRW